MLNRVVTSVVCLAASLALSGCLIESSVDAKGGATLDVTYRVGKGVTLDVERKRMESPHVKILNATLDADNNAKFTLQVDDVTKLSTAKFFEETTVTLADGEQATKVLTAKINRKTPMKLPDEALAHFGKEVKIAVTVPGDIVKSNATKTDGKTATWTYEMNAFMGAKETALNVAYKKPAGEKAAEQKPTEKKEEKK